MKSVYGRVELKRKEAFLNGIKPYMEREVISLSKLVLAVMGLYHRKYDEDWKK